MEANDYGQIGFDLPHDVVKLPSGGIFYKPKKATLKVGYLTANDENILMSPNASKDGLINTLLRNKIYEPNFDVKQLLDGDVQAILLFLRNTAFGSDYNFNLIDPATNTPFESTIIFDEVDFLPAKNKPDDEGFFFFTLPKSNKKLKLKLLTIGEKRELDELNSKYPQGMVAPVITKKLEKHIISIDGEEERTKIVTFIPQMPIADSKALKKFLDDCEPKPDLRRTVIAPSGEKVNVDFTFGVEFFRPFFE
ncbi:MAG: hypothetical protein RLZ10_2157 [Bacteroidota bacterium]|jgi:hypothetical protein